MSRQQLTPQSIDEFLVNPTYTALSAVTGVEYQNAPNRFLAWICGSTASTATFNVATEIEGLEVTAPTQALPTSNTTPQFSKPLSRNFTQADGNAYVDLSSIVGVTVACLEIPGTV
jgi:hypothetical protein